VRFRQFVGAHPTAYSSSVAVVLDSPGGDLAAGMMLGEMLRQGGWNTTVGASYHFQGTARVALCTSACVYAFVGGVNRIMMRDGTLGVHKFFYVRGGGAAAAQETVAHVNLYLDRMA
jgi:hypothetical protein